MNFQRVGNRRVVEIFACLVFAGAVGELQAQTNVFGIKTLSTTLPLPDPAEQAAKRLEQSVRFTAVSLNTNSDRPWSADISQILLLPRTREDASRYLPSSSRTGTPVAGDTNQTAAEFQEPGSSIDEARMDVLMRRIEENGYGTSNYERDRSALSRTVERGVKTLFVPEPIKLGHARLAFSPYTAIKRKNPFCLLNPIPLALSW